MDARVKFGDSKPDGSGNIRTAHYLLNNNKQMMANEGHDMTAFHF